MVENCLFGMMRTSADTLSAVNAQLRQNLRFALTNTNCACRTAVNAGDAPLALVSVKGD